MEYFIVYLLLMLDNIKDSIAAIAVISGVIFTGYLAYCWIETKPFNHVKKTAFGLSLAILLVGMLPSTKDALIIFGGGTALKILTGDRAAQIGDELYDTVLNELRKRTDNKKTESLPVPSKTE